MNKKIKDLIKPIHTEEKLLTHEETDPKQPAMQYFCSTYIQKQNILIKGECQNGDKSRGAQVVLCDPETGELKGESRVFASGLTRR